MKKFIYPFIMVNLIALFLILTPRVDDKISAYQESESHLLLPQKNVVVLALSLEDNNLNISNISTLNILKELEGRIKLIKGVNKIESLLNSSVIYSKDDDIEISSFLPSDITQKELENQISDIKKYPELKPYIDDKLDSLLFYVYFSYSVVPSYILSSLEDISISSPVKFSYTGKSPIIAVTEKLLSKDILIFIPILIFVIMVIFTTFRNKKSILISWIIIILSILLSYSLIIYSGIKVTPLILLVPVFALGLLSDYVIHYIYHLFYESHKNNPSKVRKNLIYPLGLTALSTLTGFISLVYINASGHILLGTIMALSVIFTFIGVVLWLPYLKFDIPNKKLLPKFSYFQKNVFSFLYRFRNYLFIVLVIGVIWGIVELPNLKTEPYPIEQLPRTTTIRKAESIINTNFYGSLPIFLEIDSGKANMFLEKNSLLSLNKIHNILDSNNEIGYSYSLLTVLKRINYYFMGDEESLLLSNEFDDNYSSLIEQFLLYYSTGVDPLEYESFVDPSFRYFSIKGYLKYKNVDSLNNFYTTIKALNEFLPEGWTINIHGVIKELNNEKNGLTKNWIFSFLLGSFLIFVSVLFFYKKIKLALLSLLPGFISMLLSIGIISSMNVTIDSFSIIFVAITTGLVIDYSIHTLSALDKLPKINSIRDGFSYIISYSGIPIFLSFLTSIFSFSVLFLSSFSGARNLGILLFSSLIISYILSFYLLPIIILPIKLIKEKQ